MRECRGRQGDEEDEAASFCVAGVPSARRADAPGGGLVGLALASPPAIPLQTPPQTKTNQTEPNQTEHKGPPGTGKTTSILALAHQLLGASYREAVLELNASDDRGIDVVRNKIKMFAQKKVTLPPGRHKIVILDEADRCGGAGGG